MAQGKKENENEVQEKYIQFQMIAEQMKQMQQQMQLFDEQLIDMNDVVQSLDEFKKVGRGEEMLVPVHSGIFVKGKTEDNSEFLVNVGAGVVVKKSADSTKSLLLQRAEELNMQREQVLETLQAFSQKAQVLEREISKLVE